MENIKSQHKTGDGEMSNNEYVQVPCQLLESLLKRSKNSEPISTWFDGYERGVTTILEFLLDKSQFPRQK